MTNLNVPNASPPLGLMYLAAALETHKHEVTILDLCDTKKYLVVSAGMIGLREWDAVGVTATTAQYNKAKQILGLVTNGAIKLIGGPHATACPELVRYELQDVTVLEGESEETICDYLAGKRYTSISSPPDVNRYPIPARHLLELGKYKPEVSGTKSTSLLTSRGCPFNCAFCYKTTGRTIRYRDIDNIVQEITDCKQKYGITNFVIGDDNFLTHKARALKVLESIKNLGITFKCVGRSDLVDTEILDALKASGCTQVDYGIESGSNRMLKLMNKGTRVSQNYHAIEMTQQAGLIAKAYMIVNFPGEDDISIRLTKNFITHAKPDKWLLSQFSPLPGCDVWKRPKHYGVTRISKDWDDYVLAGIGGKGGITFETGYLDKERQQEYHDELYNHMVDTLGAQGR